MGSHVSRKIRACANFRTALFFLTHKLIKINKIKIKKNKNKKIKIKKIKIKK